MIMKITALEGNIDYTQIQKCGIDGDYAIINDGEDEYWEIEPGTLHHSYLKEDDSWFNETVNIKEAEILTDNMVSIEKWELETPIDEELVAEIENIL